MLNSQSAGLNLSYRLYLLGTAEGLCGFGLSETTGASWVIDSLVFTGLR